MKGLNFATAEEVNEMAKENVRLKQSNTKLRKQLKALEAEKAKLKELGKYANYEHLDKCEYWLVSRDQREFTEICTCGFKSLRH